MIYTKSFHLIIVCWIQFQWALLLLMSSDFHCPNHFFRVQDSRWNEMSWQGQSGIFPRWSRNYLLQGMAKNLNRTLQSSHNFEIIIIMSFFKQKKFHLIFILRRWTLSNLTRMYYNLQFISWFMTYCAYLSIDFIQISAQPSPENREFVCLFATTFVISKSIFLLAIWTRGTFST